MPSPLHVPVATISAIAPHPNADSLDIAQVLGWQCVVKRGSFKEGDTVIYFAPDVMLPRELSDAWGITQYLDKQRIRATKLRGEASFGLVMPYSVLPPQLDALFEIGEDVAEYFGATKWEPPQRTRSHYGKIIDNPCGLPKDPLFPEYTHIENLRHYPNLFGSDELVVVTEKLHGTNSRIGIIDGQWMAGSHKVRRGEGDELYWSPRKQEGVEAMLTALSKYHKQVVLFGEILGSDVQSLDYGYKGYEGYRAFDLMIDGRYVDYMAFATLCSLYDVDTVPFLDYCTFDFDEIRHLANGHTEVTVDEAETICTSHLREGVVVKPLIERWDPKVGRVVAKFVSDEFLLAKKTDFAEV